MASAPTQEAGGITMSTIDITKNYRVYSPQQLREYAYNGIISCGNHDLTDFLEYIFTDFKSDEVEEAYDQGYKDGQADPDCLSDHALSEIRRAISILEDI